jgi:hypothetical protein
LGFLVLVDSLNVAVFVGVDIAIFGYFLLASIAHTMVHEHHVRRPVNTQVKMPYIFVAVV